MKKLILAVLFGFGLSALGCGSPAPPAKKEPDKKGDAKDKGGDAKDVKKGDAEKPAEKPADPPKEEKPAEKPVEAPKEEGDKKEASNEPKPKLDNVKVEGLKLE